MKLIACKQNSAEWLAARVGVVTASEVDALVTPLWKVRAGDGVQTYLYRKVAERVMNYRPDSGGTFAMDQGHLIETMARPWYEFAHDCQIQVVGFCTSDDGRVGCSPDGLIGEDGGIEIKSPQPPQHLRYLLANEVPAEYRAQVQMSLFVTGRKWWKFVSYSPYLPALVVHVEPDPKAQAALADALTAFLSELDAAEAKVRALMNPLTQTDDQKSHPHAG